MAASAATPTVGLIPGEGKEVRKIPATAASAPATPQAVAATRLSRIPMSAAVRPSSAAADGDTAALMGIRLSRTGAAGWALAGGLAAVAGIFLTSFPSPGVAPTVALSAFAAIPAWVLGGFDSVPGAIVGGLVIGVATSLTVGYESQLHFLGNGVGEVVPYAVMILVLLVRPSGLFGRKEAIRV